MDEYDTFKNLPSNYSLSLVVVSGMVGTAQKVSLNTKCNANESLEDVAEMSSKSADSDDNIPNKQNSSTIIYGDLRSAMNYGNTRNKLIPDPAVFGNLRSSWDCCKFYEDVGYSIEIEDDAYNEFLPRELEGLSVVSIPEQLGVSIKIIEIDDDEFFKRLVSFFDCISLFSLFSFFSGVIV